MKFSKIAKDENNVLCTTSAHLLCLNRYSRHWFSIQYMIEFDIFNSSFIGRQQEQ